MDICVSDSETSQQPTHGNDGTTMYQIKGYSKWFAGKQNNVTDALSKKLAQKQQQTHLNPRFSLHFKIAPLLNKISSWLTSLLQRIPVREQLRELHRTTKLEPGGDGRNTASSSNAVTFTWTDLENRRKFLCLGLLPWLSDPDDSWGNATEHWLRAQ